jgi:hypothetical protein
MGEETCGCGGLRLRVGVEREKECRGSAVGLQKDEDLLCSAILRDSHAGGRRSRKPVPFR